VFNANNRKHPKLRKELTWVYNNCFSHNVKRLVTHAQPFNGFLSRTTQVGQHQKKHSPIHPHPDHHTSFINFRHLLRSTASSLFNSHTWQSLFTTSLLSLKRIVTIRTNRKLKAKEHKLNTICNNFLSEKLKQVKTKYKLRINTNQS